MEIREDWDLCKKIKWSFQKKAVISGRKDKPNLDLDDAWNLIDLMPENDDHHRIDIEFDVNRKKEHQPYFEEGRDQVFKIKFRPLVGTRIRRYYIKGFFFDKEAINGVYLISIREE